MAEKKKFLGARIEPQMMEIVDSVAEENNVDRTTAIKILVGAGWDRLRLEKALKLYREGKVSVDRAAKIAGLNVSEMMEEVAASGIKSEETIEEYRGGVKTLLEGF